MSKDKKQALQDAFLNAVRKEKIDLTIFLKNGVKLQGIVSWFDSFCILLRKNGINQLVYKHAISTIMPSHPFKILDDDSETSQPSTNEDTNENASLKEEKITEKEE